jgi:hypothetical protein
MSYTDFDTKNWEVRPHKTLEYWNPEIRLNNRIKNPLNNQIDQTDQNLKIGKSIPIKSQNLEIRLNSRTENHLTLNNPINQDLKIGMPIPTKSRNPELCLNNRTENHLSLNNLINQTDQD